MWVRQVWMEECQTQNGELKLLDFQIRMLKDALWAQLDLEIKYLSKTLSKNC